jgi:hypothetical protein
MLVLVLVVFGKLVVALDSVEFCISELCLDLGEQHNLEMERFWNAHKQSRKEWGFGNLLGKERDR